jgi:hypothetical protein
LKVNDAKSRNPDPDPNPYPNPDPNPDLSEAWIRGSTPKCYGSAKLVSSQVKGPIKEISVKGGPLSVLP